MNGRRANSSPKGCETDNAQYPEPFRSGIVTPHVSAVEEASFQTSAISRAGPPVASFTFATPTTRVAPDAGIRSRLATFSRPQRPDGSQARCVLKSFDGP